MKLTKAMERGIYAAVEDLNETLRIAQIAQEMSMDPSRLDRKAHEERSDMFFNQSDAMRMMFDKFLNEIGYGLDFEPIGGIYIVEKLPT